MLSLLFHHFSEDVQELVLLDYENWRVEMPDKLLVYSGNNNFVNDKLEDISLLVNSQVALISKVSRYNVTIGNISCKGEEYLASLKKLDTYLFRTYTNSLPF